MCWTWREKVEKLENPLERVKLAPEDNAGSSFGYPSTGWSCRDGSLGMGNESIVRGVGKKTLGSRSGKG